MASRRSPAAARRLAPGRRDAQRDGRHAVPRPAAGARRACDRAGARGGPACAATDDRLALLFACCHPALAPDARLALTLRAVVGLTTPQIARAFLVHESTLAQRIVRAKRKIVSVGIALTVPSQADLTSRLDDVLAVVYVMFNEGFVSSTGPTQDRDLAADAVWLAGVIAASLPDEAEAWGLAAPAHHPARPQPGAVRRAATWCCSATRTGAGGTTTRSPRVSG